jgi:hypothetical protein
MKQVWKLGMVWWTRKLRIVGRPSIATLLNWPFRSLKTQGSGCDIWESGTGSMLLDLVCDCGHNGIMIASLYEGEKNDAIGWPDVGTVQKRIEEFQRNEES